MFEVTLINDQTEGGIRKAAFQTCNAVCSRQIDIELDGDVVRSVRYTGGCHGNTQGIGALVVGMKKADIISRLEGIDCKGRGTSCPDQLANALKML
ncbi:MAG: TIGR03905 family TSCPD domain-containing protein [Bacteroidales bacterium]|nr:TIGR03905 family TSCPD domain-containing protein [Bacteroidales bacterium]